MFALKIIVFFIALIIIWIIYIYNRLVTLRNRVKEAWSDIEVQLKRRYNLIPNIIETVKGYAAHERGVFEEVTEARTRAISAQGIKEKAQAENALTSTLKNLFAVAENYPQLKASQNFLELQRELSDTENKIQAARRFYNANVRDYNIYLEKFPQNTIAQKFGFRRVDFFEIEEARAAEVREVPKVKF